jgi:hypothetical protein
MLMADVVLAIGGRRQRLFGLRAIFTQRVGIGLLFVGVGIGLMVPAISSGPNLVGLLFGAIIAGLGGLYFISVTDPVFRQGKSLNDISSPSSVVGQTAKAKEEESLESKAKRLHEMVHPEDARRSKGDDSDVG